MRIHYDKLREQARARIKAKHDRELTEALRAIDLLEELGLEPQEGPPFKAKVKRVRAKDRTDAESWSQAIDRVLGQAEKPMTVAQIARALEAEGRSFPGPRLTTSIAPVIKRRAAGMGWERVGTRKPARWRKKREGTE